MPPLILLHGAVGAAVQFTSLAGALESDFEVLTLNFSGHGGQPLPDAAFSMQLFAGDVLSFIEEKQLEKPDIFGFSMGGYAALHLARHYPEKVNRIMTLGTKFTWSPDIAAHETRMLDPVKIAEKVPGFASLLEQRHAPEDWKNVLHKTAELMKALGNKPELTAEDLAQITHQVRVGVGDRDNMVGLTETMVAFQHLPNASLLVLPQTQHPFEMLDQERLVYEIRSFFK